LEARLRKEREEREALRLKAAEDIRKVQEIATIEKAAAIKEARQEAASVASRMIELSQSAQDASREELEREREMTVKQEVIPKLLHAATMTVIPVQSVTLMLVPNGGGGYRG